MRYLRLPALEVLFDATLMLVTSVAVVSATASRLACATTVVTPPPGLPVALIAVPKPDEVVSNVHRDGSLDLTVSGTATAPNLSKWAVDYGKGSSPSSWTSLADGSTQVSDSTLGVWHTAPLPNGPYTVRLQVWDMAGHVAVASRTVTVSNFKVSQDALQLNAAAKRVVRYTSDIPFTMRETLVIKNGLGRVVRTLADRQRTAGVYTDAWDGRDNRGALLPDGPYYYVVTVQDDSATMTWDLSREYLDNYFEPKESLDVQPFDPFHNRPLRVTYNFAVAGQLTVSLFNHGLRSFDCDQPPQRVLCVVNGKYEESGPHTFVWAGVDPAGLYVANAYSLISVTMTRSRFAKNAVVLFGTRPTLENLAITPPEFTPSPVTATVSFDLRTFQNQPADVTVTFLGQSSRSTLRTISLPGQAPGRVTFQWDGRADNGMLVAPGFYTITVTATDGIGNQAQGQILATVYR